jgi:flagellar motor switch/type III secretory pathway protein FliN
MDQDIKKSLTEGAIADVSTAGWNLVGLLPCVATLEIAVPIFTVAELLALKPGDVVETRWAAGAEIPLNVNRAQVAWGELELLGDRLAVRLTELR